MWFRCRPLQCTDSLLQPGGEREGAVGTLGGQIHLHDKSSNDQGRQGIPGSERKWRVRLHSPPSFPLWEGTSDQGRRKGQQGAGKWATQHSHSCCVRSGSSRMCRDLLDCWKEDGTKLKEQPRGKKQKEGRRSRIWVFLFCGGTWGSVFPSGSKFLPGTERKSCPGITPSISLLQGQNELSGECVWKITAFSVLFFSGVWLLIGLAFEDFRTCYTSALLDSKGGGGSRGGKKTGRRENWS